MRRAPLLTLALFLPAFAAAQQQPYAGPFAGQPNLETCPGNEEPVPLPPGGCAALNLARDIVSSLRGAAGLSAHALRAWIDVWSSRPTASYGMDIVTVTWPLLREYGDDEAVMIMILSHETGHAVQAKRDLWPEDRYQKKGFTARQIEAQADIHGVVLAGRVGLPGDEWLKALDRYAAHGGVASSAGGGSTHPSMDVRRANVRYFLSRSTQEVPGPENFDAEGRLR